MKIAGIEWDHANRGHFQEHGRCRQHEVEEVLLSKSHPSRIRDQAVAQGAEPRKRILGQTCEGRYLTVVAVVRSGNVFRPITCWPTTGRHLDAYLAWRRTIRR